MPRPSRQLGIAHRAQLPAQRLPADRQAEALPEPLHEVDEAPAHDAVKIGLRPLLDGRGERRAMLRVQERRLARRLAVDEPGRTFGVEPQHPVPDALQTNVADLRRRRPRTAIVDDRQRQKPRVCCASTLAFASLRRPNAP